MTNTSKSGFSWILLVVVAVLGLLFLTAVEGHCQTNPLPLGTVSNVQSVSSCLTGFASGASCWTATVSCPPLPDIVVTFGIKGTATKGTVIFVNGDGGTLPYGQPYVAPYGNAGLSSVQLAFATSWELGGASNLMQAACRPATMMNYFYQPGVPYAVQSTSAGSGAVGYAFAWYGLAFEFKNWEAVVGPVFSDIVQGCEEPAAGVITVIPTNGLLFDDTPQYVKESGFMTQTTGYKCLQKSGFSSQAALASWAAQEILAPGATLSFPGTAISSWVCNNGLNPSAAQAYLFFSQVATPWSMTAISNCVGAEGVGPGFTPQGVTGTAAITADMVLVMTGVK
jgi:hypothetical protein